MRRRVDALVSCCDVYVWRLLRHDMGRSRQEAEAIVVAISTLRAKGPKWSNAETKGYVPARDSRP